MIELQGKFNKAKVFTDTIDETTIGQVIELCNQEFIKNSQIRIMPDCHAGAGCVIGTTMTLTDKVVPNLVGVDIGCGMFVVELGQIEIDFKQLDRLIHQEIPSGFNVRSKAHNRSSYVDFYFLNAKDLSLERAGLSIGSLGSGNHFVEVDVDDEGNKYLVIHSGSRNLGKQVAEYWQTQAVEQRGVSSERKAIRDLAYLDGDLFNAYINDMEICQNFANQNRMAMGEVICEGMKWEPVRIFQTIHNYIDVEDKILRKGAVSAELGERLIIPINMRDGSIIAIGKGNEDWNRSAPHGAGRLFGRGEAKRTLSMDLFTETMKDVYSTCVTEATLDESPMAYKGMQEIIDNTADTITIERIIKPLYNFKAVEEKRR